jgi:hypothetical protein
MGLFDRKVSKAAISPAPNKAAAAGGMSPGYNSSNAGINMIGQYYTYREGEARNRAISVPTINRARDLMASVIGSMPLKMYTEMWNGDDMEKVYLAPRSWIRRPDPNVSFQFLMSWTLDDLMMYGRAFWYISSRTADGYPATFTRLPAGSGRAVGPDPGGGFSESPLQRLHAPGISASGTDHRSPPAHGHGDPESAR